jgi:hypothetical protein
MEKRFRDYLRHLEKLDLDVISEEEVLEERGKLQMRMDELHDEMMRLLIPITGTMICASIFFAVGLLNMSMPNFICGGVFTAIFIWLLLRYRTLCDEDRRLDAFLDKLTVN